MAEVDNTNVIEGESYVKLRDIEQQAQKVYEPLEESNTVQTEDVQLQLDHPPTVTKRSLQPRSRSAKYHEGTSALKLKGDQKEGKDTVMSLESLGDLTQHYTNLGNLGCVIVKGVQGYCSFINGIYRRVEDLFFEQRLDTMVPHGNSIAAGKFLYLYYKAGQRAWAIGLKLGSSGVLAYRKVQGIDPVSGDIPWMVTDPQGNFFEDVNLRTRMAGGYTVPHKEDAHLLDRTSMSGALPYGFTRLKAEALLLQHYAEHRQGGVFVLRRSTSVADAIIVSVLDPQGRCHHLQIDIARDWCQICGTAICAKSISDILDILQSQNVCLVNGKEFPLLYMPLLDNPKYVALVQTTSSSCSSGSATMSRTGSLPTRLQHKSVDARSSSKTVLQRVVKSSSQLLHPTSTDTTIQENEPQIQESHNQSQTS